MHSLYMLCIPSLDMKDTLGRECYVDGDNKN